MPRSVRIKSDAVVNTITCPDCSASVTVPVIEPVGHRSRVETDCVCGTHFSIDMRIRG